MNFPKKNETSRDRPKSAPYLRLKNSKRTSICQSIGELGTLLWKKILEKKSHNAEKTERVDPLGVFNNHFVAKHQKIEGGTLWGIFFPEKSLTMPKKLKGGPFGLARYGMLRGKTGKTFLVQFARPNGAIIFCRTFGRTILVSPGGLKKKH